MATSRLQNYLRMYRKRSGLTQDEVGYLLRSKNGAKVSRLELCRRIPTLETALVYEVIFGTPVRELFAGLFEEVERKTMRRVGLLARKLHNADKNRYTDRKLEALAVAVKESGRTPAIRK